MPYNKQDISAIVYECVSRTELQDKDRETAEMMLDMADSMIDWDFSTEMDMHQPLQHTGRDCEKKRSSRAALVCSVLLCLLLLNAVIVLSVYIHKNYTDERETPLNNIHNLTEEKKQILTKLTNQIQQIDQLNQEKNALLRSFNGMDGWFYFQSSLYFISSDRRSWSESRKYCTDRGADLVIINNRLEQNFVQKRSGISGVWIGLTDSDEEGIWKWVDGSNMTSGFWGSGEPNGHTQANCVMFTSSSWYDTPCTDALKWACEKNIFH